MKYHILIFFFLVFTISCKKVEIETQYNEYDLGESISVNRIISQRDSTLFLCGGKKNTIGSIYRSSDKGSSWHKVHSVSGRSLYDVHFINDTLGYACGDRTFLLKTIDGGATWQQFQFYFTPVHGYDLAMHKIASVGHPDTFMIAGGDGFEAGVLFKTYDGGNTWIYDQFNNELRFACFIRPFSPNILLGGYGAMFSGKISEREYPRLPLSDDYFTSMACLRMNVFYTVGYNGGIYKTEDAGQSWKTLKKPNAIISSRIHYNSISASTTIVAVGNNGLVNVSYSDGENWHIFSKPTVSNIMSSLAHDGKLLLGSSDGKVYSTPF